MNAVAGLFVAFRTVAIRGVTVLTIDVPGEDAQHALDTLGMPEPGYSVHVAITPLRPDGEEAPETPAVTNGTLEAQRLVAGRSALALSIEIPAERGHAALKALGVPHPGRKLWVGIAPLGTREALPPAPPAKDPASVAIQQAALRPKDEAFQRWILEGGFVEGDARGNELSAVEAIRTQLGISSRAHLREEETLKEWHALLRRFEVWLQGGVAELAE